MVSLCLGEAGYLQSFIALLIALLGWIFILYEIFSGEISKYFEKINDKHLVIIFKTMRMIIAAGWAIYPLGYIFGYLTTSFESGSLNAIYNLAEFVNKIAFCLIVWLVVVKNAPLSRR